ncbi:MAG: tryptophan synthase subunit alpha, partial [Cyanobacteria bacterium]|nr:tryptophan synthase subunit alpha [Cyanobacteriota bacterium]
MNKFNLKKNKFNNNINNKNNKGNKNNSNISFDVNDMKNNDNDNKFNIENKTVIGANANIIIDANIIAIANNGIGIKTIAKTETNNFSGKSKIDLVFEKLRVKNQKGFIPFVTCGYPDLDGYKKLVNVLEANGADIIEIGIPFSDPLADGPIIQTTSKIALDNGINTDIVFNSIKEIRNGSSIPLVLMTYFNTIYSYGINKFLKNAEEAGVDGLIIPDLPLEEYYNCKDYFEESKIDNIMLASLRSNQERLKRISNITKGFLYCVSVKGVTGVRNKIDIEVIEFLKRLKEITDVPLALGFGISTISQINEVKKYCDAVIMGSKILSVLLNSDNFSNGLESIFDF